MTGRGKLVGRELLRTETEQVKQLEWLSTNER